MLDVDTQPMKAHTHEPGTRTHARKHMPSDTHIHTHSPPQHIHKHTRLHAHVRTHVHTHTHPQS